MFGLDQEQLQTLGLQLAARPLAEETLIQLCTDWHRRKPTL